MSGITTDYSGNYIYENGALQFFNTAEGYVEPKGTGWEYVFQYKDHLGNIRLSYADVSTTSTPILQIREENNYYPFGLKHKGYNNAVGGSRDHKYGYNGKEEQDELSLAWLDFGARNYDAALGRWMNLDPLAERYFSMTPYISFINNPISIIDPDGRDIKFFQIVTVKTKHGEKTVRKEVDFSELDEKTQKGLEAFAKTDEGKSFLGLFAKKGDKVGDVEFGKDGEFSDNTFGVMNFSSSNPLAAEGSSEFVVNFDNKSVFFKLKINADKNRNAEDAAITVGHEALIHIDKFLRKLIGALKEGRNDEVIELKKEVYDGGEKDHIRYQTDRNSFKKFLNFVSQLKNILNPEEVDRQLERHDKNNKNE